MDERGQVELSTDGRRRVLARLRMRGAGTDAALHAALPSLRTTVGGFVLEEVLGEGGHGTVFLARRGGCVAAVKFLYLPRIGARARRELDVMLRLEEVGGVGLKGHGFWPDEEPLFLFIAMEYVPGEELYAWAHHHNPNAQEAVEVWLELTRELGVVHSAGVVHRDLKGDNVLVRHADGLPVLVDFGVATYEGARRLTGQEVPGCREYLSPQAVRFNREHPPGEHYTSSAGDDLWALGVLAYKLLTGTYPFLGYNALETERAILQARPEAPHVRNPRVPRALSEVCLRLLEKEPEARYPDAAAVEAALEEVKREADAAWTVPLCESWGPDAATTRREGPLLVEQIGARSRRLREYERRPPRRGVPRPARETRPASRWTLGEGVRVLMLILAGLLCAGHPRTVSTPVLVSRVSAPMMTPRVVSRGQEVAPWWRPPEGDGGAEPWWAATPAPVASATRPEDTRVKTSWKDSAPPEKNQRPHGPVRRAGKTLLVCALATGCSSPGTQVRPQPGPAECPAGAAEAMDKLGAWSFLAVTLTPQGRGGGRVLTVSGGESSVRLLDDSGTLVAGSILTGQLIVTDKRVYGRFTRARLSSGETLPVCFEFVAREKPGAPELPGALVEGTGPEPGLVQIFSSQYVAPVRRFSIAPSE